MARHRALTIEELTRRPVLTTGDIARLSTHKRERVWQLAAAGKIPAKRANPGGSQYRYYNSAKLRAWCEKEKRRLAARPAHQEPRPEFSRDFPFINDFWKWDRQVQIGQVPLPRVEVLRHDLEESIRLIAKHCGEDWVRAVTKTRAAGAHDARGHHAGHGAGHHN